MTPRGPLGTGRPASRSAFSHPPTVIRRIACAAKYFAEQCVNLVPKRAWRVARVRIGEIEFVEYNNAAGFQKFQQMADDGAGCAGKVECNGRRLRRTGLERLIRRGCSPGTKPRRNSPAGVCPLARSLSPHGITDRLRARVALTVQTIAATSRATSPIPDPTSSTRIPGLIPAIRKNFSVNGAPLLRLQGEPLVFIRGLTQNVVRRNDSRPLKPAAYSTSEHCSPGFSSTRTR